MWRYRSMTGLAGICLLFVAAASSVAAPREVKNVLLIGVDDLNTAVGCYGADWVSTPNIDRLASRGVRFTRAYAPQPVCNPARVSLLSGQYPETTGILRNVMDPRDLEFLPEMRFLPEVYEEAGYFTAAIGKLEHGRFVGGMELDEIDNPKDRFDKGKVVDSGEFAGRFPWASVDAPDEAFGDGRIASRVVELLERQSQSEEPFLISAGFHKPHIPHTAPRRFFEAHPPEEMPLMPDGGDPIPDGTRGPREGVRKIPEFTDAEERQIISHYAAATSFMDEQLGRVLDKMDELDLWRNTAVVFWSDHGWSMGQHGHWSKFNQFDSSARIPFIIVTPGTTPSESDTPVDLTDVFPTLMELSGLETPHELDGESLVKVLDDPDALTDGIAYGVFGRAGPHEARVRSIRTPDFTYIQYFNGDDLLYAADDPDELDDLSDAEAYAETVARMKKLLQRAPDFRR